LYKLLFRLLNAFGPVSGRRFAILFIRLFYRIGRYLPRPGLPAAPVDTMGLVFPNPVGLAAGLDRDGSLLQELGRSAFGFIEIGTINIDSLNENQDQTTTLLKNMRRARNLHDASKNPRLFGVSTGSLETRVDTRIFQDIARAMELLRDYADFMVINLSRPGSPARDRKLDADRLDKLLGRIIEKDKELAKTGRKKVPLLIKVAVRIDDDAGNRELLRLAVNHGFSGAILAFENRDSMDEVAVYISKLRTRFESLSLIVVGGIHTAADAGRILDAGASLVQMYSCFVMRGPYQTEKVIGDIAAAWQARQSGC